MKKNICLILIQVIIISIIFAAEKPNYNEGNGTIISITNQENCKITIRKHNQKVKIGDLATEKRRIIYDDYFSKKIIGKLNDNDEINILEICRLDFTNTNKPEIWFSIKKDNLAGWIFIGNDKYSDPYRNNCWEILGQIQDKKSIWTVRRLEQSLSVWENLNIRNLPGVKGTTVIYTIRPGDKDPAQSNVKVLAMTEELDFIDGSYDHWVKIEYKGNIGWIFGKYTSAERGGPKYYIPKDSIGFYLGWY
ncbi:MAG: SH3 domain-containing protein [Treponema sp.]|jgi:hypothetical protein|nr:SH3 domain-containing protein [Treponema sp.]